MIEIERRYELDMGHRVPGHGGKCKRLHGHRYVCLATAVGPVEADGLEEESGMVLDFGALKAAMAAVLDPYDHQLVLWEGDPLADALSYGELSDLTTPVLCPVVPTAERLAEWWGEGIDALLRRPVALARLTVYETPNCTATWTNPNAPGQRP